MRCCRVIAGLALALSVMPPAAAYADLVFATEGNYPPWNLTESDGTLNGFDIDLVKTICEKLNTSCMFKTALWPQMMDELAAGEYDAIISGIAITPERAETIQFTVPYMSYAASFATARDNPLAELESPALSMADTLALLETARIGAQMGTVNSDFVETILPEAFLVRFPDQESLNGAVANGEVQAGFAGTPTWTDPQPAKVTALTTLGPPITSADYPALGRGLGIGIAQGNDALQTSLDAAICQLAADGTISALTVVWFGHSLSVPCSD